MKDKEKKLPKRVIIIDPQLKDTLGHNYRYAKGIKFMFQADTIVIGHKSFNDFSTDIIVHPLLTFDQYDNSAFKKGYKDSLVYRLNRYLNIIESRKKSAYAIWRENTPFGKCLEVFPFVTKLFIFLFGFIYQLLKFITGYGSSAHRDLAAEELLKSLNRMELKSDDLVVFQTMMWPTFESLLELNVLKKDSYQCQALFIAHEDWTIYHSMYGRFVPSNFQRRVLESLPFRESKVVVTNERLQNYCELWLGYTPKVISEINSEGSQLRLSSSSEKDVDEIKVLIPGVFRGDKGFHKIPVFLQCLSSYKVKYSVFMHETVVNGIDLPPEEADFINIYNSVESYSEWLQFLNEFNVVYIPYEEEYKHRISGILHECKLLNLPVICSSIIADSVYIKNSELLIDLSKIESVHCALDFIRDSSFHEVEYFKYYEYLSLFEEFKCLDGWVARIEKPVAYLIKPAWTRCGTSNVLDYQNNILVDNGYFVIELYLKGEPWIRSSDQVEFMNEVLQGGRLNSGGMICRVLLKNITMFRLFTYTVNKILGMFECFLQREEEHLSWCDLDRNLEAYNNLIKPKLVLVNHVFNSKFAFKKFKADKFICESHDIQLNQFIFRRPYLKQRYQEEFDYEMERLANFDIVVNLNKIEHLNIRNSIGDRAKFIRPPIHKWPNRKEYTSLNDLIFDQGSKSFDKDFLPSKLNLLIIADGHPANITSINEFVSNLFLKNSFEISLGIVGSVCNYLDIDWENKKFEKLFTFGYLKDLCNIYDYAELIVLPDQAGEGIPIKTDEAIANRATIVATKKALRGYSEDELSLFSVYKFDDLGQLVRELPYMLANVRAVGSDMLANKNELTLPVSLGVDYYRRRWFELLNS